MKDILYIIIPAYNEEKNIASVIQEWHPVIEKHNENGLSRIVVIDDGSKDNTYAILENLKEKYPLLVALKKANEGHGATLWEGYQYALANGADYIFQTDSDGQTSADEFETFWENREKYSMVIGHRCKREDGADRVFVTKVLKLVLRMIFGLSITDANTPYRLMKADSLKICMDIIPQKHFLTNVLLSVVYHKKMDVLYIPITFRDRQGGKNSINLVKIFKIGLSALKDFREFKNRLEM